MKLVRAKEGYRKVGDKYLLAKKCTKCGRWLIASTDNYYKNKTSKCGLESYCKECKKGYDKQWQETNRDRKVENNKKYRKQYYKNNKDKEAEYNKQYREANKERIAEYNKQWYENNRNKRAQYYENNKDKILEWQKQYRQSPQGKVALFNGQQRRRIKEEEQGTGITKDQWLEMMKFFGFRCAYSGEVLSNKTRSIDHIVPISTGGDNMIWNMVPMTRSLNSSKHANNMEEWYKEQDCYDPKRLQKIYEWKEYARKKWKK